MTPLRASAAAVGQPPTGVVPSWQEAMRRAIRDPRELCRALALPAEWADSALPAASPFGLFVPWEFLRRMRPGDPADPLLLQVLPQAQEIVPVPGYTPDPVGERAAMPWPGLLQKYHGRALLITTGACAVHCRYCFRRHFPYSDTPKRLADWEPALEEIAADKEISEVILSGGDPLTLPDSQLGRLVARLEQIPHLRRLRLHTRLPVVIPQRICPAMLDWLARSRLARIVVLHVNHPHELDGAVWRAVAELLDAGATVLNQAVLLRGVNDDVAVLEQLCLALAEHRVMPYYLHLLDPVAGAAHFDVPLADALALMEQLRTRLPGYAMPRLAREVPGEPAKRVLAG